MFFVCSAGNAYGSALREGKSEPEAMQYGITTGVLEAGTQYMLGGIAKLGGKLPAKLLDKIDDVMKVAIENPELRKELTSTVSYIGSMGAEALEEWVQANLEPVVRNVIFNENNEIRPFSADKMEAALIGFLTAGITEAPVMIDGQRIFSDR